MIHLPGFSFTAFIHGKNCLIAFLIGTRSLAHIFQTDFSFFFSSASDADDLPDLSS